MKKRNRLLAIVLTAIMTLSMVPSAVFATEAAGSGETAEAAVEEVSSVGEEQDAEPAAEEVTSAEETAKENVQAAEEDDEAEAEEAVTEEAADPAMDQENEAAEEEAAGPEETEETVEPAAAAEEEVAAEEAAETVEWPVTLESKGSDYTVTASFDESAGFPADAKMKVSEIKKSSGAYQDYYDQALESVQNETDRDIELTYARFFDITFYTEKGEVEPTGPVNVSIKYRKAIEVESRDDVHVLHFDDNDKAAPEIMDIETGGKGDKVNEVSFEADSFSVYAVIGTTDPVNGDNARMTVNFIGADGETVGTMIVKNADKSNLDSIIYDPGAGTIPDGYVFYGWSVDDRMDIDGNYYADQYDGANYTAATELKTIETVETYISSLLSTDEDQGITEGDVLNIYAAVFTHYKVEYFDNKGISLGSDSVKVRNPGTDIVSYPVNMGYNVDDSHKFEGWIPDSDADIANITNYPEGAEPTQENENIYYYENSKQISIKGDVKFRVSAPAGKWLIFNENGKGATYNAPQFVLTGETTKAPTVDMVRYGYRFDGWYKDAACSDGQEFTFGGQITETTTIYAKWIPNETAVYTVLVWIQKVSGSGYDFAESKIITGATVGDQIAVATTDTTATVAGNTYSYEGFKFGRYAYSNNNSTIVPEGTTVVNIYFDRNEYTLSFQIQQGGYIYTEEMASTTGQHYGYYNNQYVQIYYNNGTWYRNRSGNWYSGYTYSDPYDGTRYTRSYSQWTTIKEIKALYEANIRDQFPIVGTNGVTYDNGERWEPQNDPEWKQVMVYVETMPSRNVVFHLDDPGNRPWKTMYYYVEALEGDENTRTYGGTEYTKYNEVRARYNGVTEEDFVALEGFTKLEAADENDTKLELFTDDNVNYYYIYDTSNEQSIYFYYTRKSYTINYMDSVYVDGNNNVIETGTTSLHESSRIEYGADISAEGNYVPKLPSDKKGYVFEGWFIDEACTTKYVFDKMPLGGVTVYAKWRQIQYRVFLHANVPVSDESLTWGSENQAHSFRISYGGKVSAPTGKRDGYEFLGWYSDEALSTVFNADIFILNETTVTKAYNKNTDYTDPEKRPWGIYSSDPESDLYDESVTLTNSDLTGWDDDNDASTPGKDRYWITKKLDLYAKWSEIIEGADGIDIIYDENTQGGGLEGTAPVDNNQYKDNTQAVAGAASKPQDADKVFSHWVVQKWNADTNTFEDTSEKALPGGKYTVHVADARKEAARDDNNEVIPDRYVYTIQLRAEYKDAKEEETPTHIPWYKNDGTDAFHIDTIEGTQSTLSINEAVSIQSAPVRDGYTFLGWSKVEMGSTAAAVETWEATPSNWTQDLKTPNFLYYKEDKFYTDSNYTNEVTEVAADQSAPFHALFAVWERTPFYIYHSATGDTEEITLEEGVTTCDLTTKVTPGNLYGGYYHYDEVNGVRTKGDAYTDNGKALEPTGGTYYYLKEVDERHLRPKLYLVYNENHDNLIQGLYGIVSVDDSYYSEVGLIIDDARYEVEELVEEINVVEEGTETVKDTISSIDNFGPDGLIGMHDLTDKIAGGARIDIKGYYKTPDGVVVTGNKDRRIQFPAGDGSYDNMPLFTGWGSGAGQTRTGLVKSTSTTTYESRSAAGRMRTSRMLTITAPSDEAEYKITKVYDSGTEEQVVEGGDCTGKITYAAKSGYMFAGWYQDADFTVPADFADVNADMTVYAKYVSSKDVKLAFKRTGKKGTITNFNVTVTVKGQDPLADVSVNIVDGNAAVLATRNVKKSGSGSNVKYTTEYKGPAGVEGLAKVDSFKAFVSWTTPDGTVVAGEEKTCNYREILGSVTVR